MKSQANVGDESQSFKQELKLWKSKQDNKRVFVPNIRKLKLTLKMRALGLKYQKNFKPFSLNKILLEVLLFRVLGCFDKIETKIMATSACLIFHLSKWTVDPCSLRSDFHATSPDNIRFRPVTNENLSAQTTLSPYFDAEFQQWDDERFEMALRSTTLPYKNFKEADFSNLNYAISMSAAK